MFWTQPLPLGIRGVQIATLIDIDEMGIFLQMTNRCYGKSISGVRCREPGAYGQHDDKYTLILAIGTNGFKHASLENIPGMSCVYVEKCICVTYISALL